MPDINHIKFALGVEVVTIETALNFYPRNILAEIYRFRERQLRALNWVDGISYIALPNSSEFSENDLQDNYGTIYFTKSDCRGNIVGMIRLSPSIDVNGKSISMLGTTMSHLVYKNNLPKAVNIYEASRLVLDKNSLNTKALRTPVINELLAATVFFADQNNITEFFGFMINKIWKSTYERLDFDLEQIGPNKRMRDNNGSSYIVSARRIKFDGKIIKKTKADSSILNFGRNPMKI